MANLNVILASGAFVAGCAHLSSLLLDGVGECLEFVKMGLFGFARAQPAVSINTCLNASLPQLRRNLGEVVA